MVNIIREEDDRALRTSAGLAQEEDLFAPVLPSAKRRALWLGINLVTVFAAAWVIGRFEEALDKTIFGFTAPVSRRSSPLRWFSNCLRRQPQAWLYH